MDQHIRRQAEPLPRCADTSGTVTDMWQLPLGGEDAEGGITLLGRVTGGGEADTVAIWQLDFEVNAQCNRLRMICIAHHSGPCSPWRLYSSLMPNCAWAHVLFDIRAFSNEWSITTI